MPLMLACLLIQMPNGLLKKFTQRPMRSDTLKSDIHIQFDAK
jgi:hypothetical protein